MTSHANTTDKKRSTGTVTATIDETKNGKHNFKADAGRQHFYKAGEHWFIVTSEHLSAPYAGFYGISIDLPSSFKDDGVQRTYHFPSEVTGGLTIPWNTGGLVCRAISGSITLSLKDEVMTAKFAFEARNESYKHDVSLTGGDLKLSGASIPKSQSGDFDATFEGGGFPNDKFKADHVEIYAVSQPDAPRRFNIAGVENYTPINFARIVVQINEGLPPEKYELKGDVYKVGVLCFKNPNFGPFRAQSGTLTIESHPSTGHGKGTFKCEFSPGNGVPPFKATGTFNVHAPILYKDESEI